MPVPARLLAEGFNNRTAGQGACIPGGVQNQALGNYSFAAGLGATAANDGAFVWNDSQHIPVSSSAPDQFIALAPQAGFFFYTSPALGSGVSVAAEAGGWSSLSDRNAKENFRPVDAQAVLARVAALPISRWNYKTQDQSIRHVGPVAQDFQANFGVGEDDRHISTVDEAGISLAAIRG